MSNAWHAPCERLPRACTQPGVLVIAIAIVLAATGCARQSATSHHGYLSTTSLNTTVSIPNRFKHKVAVTPLGVSNDRRAPFVQASQQAKTWLDERLLRSDHFMLLSHEVLRTPLPLQGLLDVNDEVLGADFLVTGEIVQHELSLPGFFSGWREPRQATAHSEIVLRVIDGHTGQEIHTYTTQADVHESLGDATSLKPEAHDRLQTRALTQALNTAMPVLTKTLLQRRWRSQILSAQQGYVLINSGAGQGIRIGDELQVIVREPTEARDLSGQPPLVARLRVVGLAGDAEDELSVCELIEGQLPTDDLSRLSVLSLP